MRVSKSESNSFTILLECESPLILGGADTKELDEAFWLRGLSVRGLIHTFTRALLAPLLGMDMKRIWRAEHYLLGSAAGDEGDPPTFRVDIFQMDCDPLHRIKCLLLPHKLIDNPADKCGERSALKVTTKFNLKFTVLPHVENAREFREVLWAIVWTAFSLGALGKRSRRGYGALRILGCTPASEWESLSLPVLVDSPEDSNSLGFYLRGGLFTAQEYVKQWLQKSDNLAALEEPTVELHPIFCIDELHRIAIGKVFTELGEYSKNVEALLPTLMKTCHDKKFSNRKVYDSGFGYVWEKDNLRMASPLWVRVYRVREGFVPVLTYSPRVTGDEVDTIYRDFLKQMGATGRTLDTFNA